MSPVYEISMWDPETGTQAFIVIDRLVDGLSAGGLRMSPDVTLDMIRDLASTMTQKYAAMGITLGGAKAGIVGDPTAPDREAKLARFAQMAKPILKSIYMVGEDMGVTGRDVELIYQTIEHNPIEFILDRLSRRGVTIEVPPTLGLQDLFSESFGAKAAGTGVAHAVEVACAFLQMSLSGTTISIQGFGTVGGVTAMRLAEKGAIITTVEDAHGCLYNPVGLPVVELLQIRDALGNIDRNRLPATVKQLPSGSWLDTGAQVLIPAAVSGVIHEGNQHRVQAQLIVEGANLPITPKATEQLSERGIVIIPDIIANAGTASLFGLLMTGQASLANVVEEYLRRITQAVYWVLKESQRRGCTTRYAAQQLAKEFLNASVTTGKTK